MAVEQTEKRRNVARQAVQLAPALMDVLYQIDALRKKRNTGGPNGTALVFQDSDFAGVSGLQHLDAATIDKFFTDVPTILTSFVNGNYDDTFEALRP